VNIDGISAVFGRVLDHPDIHPDTDFFDLGGDSLLATRVLSAIARESGVELTFGEFTQARTPELLARAISGAGR
jgi:acyl carrier protein